MALGRRNNDQTTTSNQTTEPTAAPEALNSVSQEELLDKPGAHTCESCGGRGVRPEVSEYELCADCHGSGTIEADK